MTEQKLKLVDADTLLTELFDENARPSLRWLRTQTARKAIPHVKIGRLVFFDLPMVKAYLERKRTVAAN